MITSLVTALTVETCRAFAEPSALAVTPLPVPDRGSADIAIARNSAASLAMMLSTASCQSRCRHAQRRMA